MSHINIFIEEENYYPYYMQWVTFYILSTELLENINPFVTTLIIHCKYENGEIDKGRYLSPIYRTITSVNKSHPGITTGYSIISFK